MLAPIREYLAPKDPRSSPLLCATKDRYFSRLSVDLDPNAPTFGEARWIVSEDVNVEHLLDVLTSIDPDATGDWEACCYFLEHLYRHKPRNTILGSKIEGLPDGHPSKPKCLFRLSKLLNFVGNYAERKRLLTHLLELSRQSGDEFLVFEALRSLSDVNRLLGLHEEGIKQAKEALKVCERGGDAINQALCLLDLARLLFDDKQLDDAQDAASRAVDLLPEKGQEYKRCQLYRILGKIYRSRGEREKAIHHFETSIGIGSRFNWHGELFRNHYNLAKLFCGEDELDRANAHIEQAKSYTSDNTLMMARAMSLQAEVWCSQGRPADAKSQALHALEVFERLGAAIDVERCGDLLQRIE